MKKLVEKQKKREEPIRKLDEKLILNTLLQTKKMKNEISFTENKENKENLSLRKIFSQKTGIPINRILIIAHNKETLQLFSDYDPNLIKEIRKWKKKGLWIRFEKFSDGIKNPKWIVNTHKNCPQTILSFLNELSFFPCIVLISHSSKKVYILTDENYQIVYSSYPFILSSPAKINPVDLAVQLISKYGIPKHKEEILRGYLLTADKGEVFFTNLSKFDKTVFWYLPLICLRFNCSSSSLMLVLYSVIKKELTYAFWMNDKITKHQFKEFANWYNFFKLPFYTVLQNSLSDHLQKLPQNSPQTSSQVSPQVSPQNPCLQNNLSHSSLVKVNEKIVTSFKKEVRKILKEKEFNHKLFIGIEGIDFCFLQSHIVDTNSDFITNAYTFKKESFKLFSSKRMHKEHNCPALVFSSFFFTAYINSLASSFDLKEVIIHELTHQILFSLEEELKKKLKHRKDLQEELQSFLDEIHSHSDTSKEIIFKEIEETLSKKSFLQTLRIAKEKIEKMLSL